MGVQHPAVSPHSRLAHRPSAVRGRGRSQAIQARSHRHVRGICRDIGVGVRCGSRLKEATALVDYAEELYRDWNDGGRSSGGASRAINAEFDRIRRELDDLRGIVASPARLRTMLEHLTKTLHPGILNDCFYRHETAVCAKRATTYGRPLPLLNMCCTCPNARRSRVHLPRLTLAHDQARQALQQAEARPLPPLQRSALTGHAEQLDQLIAQITEDGEPQPT